ncbi:MAG: 3-deoxy-8-phosphooctulonate synthase [Candidatus Latescibacteria bacterium]|nr:3-deoxy-8-phosphooctulonate synthase [Candidatus Latescibacterota bacterium]
MWHPFPVGPVDLLPSRLALIAGPCVLEDPGMAEEVAEEVKRIAERLDLAFVFKASYSKANRSSGASYRGPGLEEGLATLGRIRDRVGVPVTSDVHETSEVGAAAEVLDLIQIPAFLCRQTALIEAAARSGKPVHLKKGQFLDPGAMGYAVEKARAAGAPGVIVTERGTAFGYGDLVVDFRGIAIMKRFRCPVFFDATHSVQRPGGIETLGQREFVPVLARAAIAAGADGIFIETHPDPPKARSDRDCQWPLKDLAALLQSLMEIRHSISDRRFMEAMEP